jgi:regulator-associated protein of mTOR
VFSVDDGVVRLYKNYDGSEQEDAILVSSWRALKDMEKSNSRQSGLVCEWHQGRGALFTGGDARAIKVWDAHQEMTVMVSDNTKRGQKLTIIY